MIEFVVARCTEDLAWTNGLPGAVTVYNKGDPHLRETVRLPNVGRESHTYFEHIVRNYEQLADVTVFCQGNPFDHAPSMLDQLHALTGEFESFSPHLLSCEWDGCPDHGGLPIAEIWNSLMPEREKPERLYFGPGAVFYATRRAIRLNPPEFYRRARTAHEAFEAAPWVFERLWAYIFCCEAREFSAAPLSEANATCVS